MNSQGPRLCTASHTTRDFYSSQIILKNARTDVTFTHAFEVTENKTRSKRRSVCLLAVVPGFTCDCVPASLIVPDPKISGTLSTSYSTWTSLCGAFGGFREVKNFIKCIWRCECLALRPYGRTTTSAQVRTKGETKAPHFPDE